jgi:2-polyprenyl-3-methyl-5-hydroxy-6-metoxy-1,4-benzoquinol methylase
MTSDQLSNFNNFYHILRDGNLDQTNETWTKLFDSLADRIIMDLQPASVLDAGCSRGYLLKSLRQRGVEAWGIDGSEDAIQNAIPESQAFCYIGSLVDPFPHPHYDLIICIDTIEHYSPEEAIRAVENLCLHSDNILLSCIPIEYGNSTILNAQPPGYWASLFSGFGFIHDINFDASFIAPWAMRFRH